jgi:hypothetical protein
MQQIIAWLFTHPTSLRSPPSLRKRKEGLLLIFFFPLSAKGGERVASAAKSGELTKPCILNHMLTYVINELLLSGSLRLTKIGNIIVLPCSL